MSEINNYRLNSKLFFVMLGVIFGLIVIITLTFGIFFRDLYTNKYIQNATTVSSSSQSISSSQNQTNKPEPYKGRLVEAVANGKVQIVV
jgi:hypothetical protein